MCSTARAGTAKPVLAASPSESTLFSISLRDLSGQSPRFRPVAPCTSFAPRPFPFHRSRLTRTQLEYVDDELHGARARLSRNRPRHDADPRMGAYRQRRAASSSSFRATRFDADAQTSSMYDPLAAQEAASACSSRPPFDRY
jgi:hypothetical protein